MTPEEIVGSFMRAATRCLDALASEYSGLERPTVWTGLILRPRGGRNDPVRAGELPGIGKFKLHGRGCQFELDSGEDLDIDWDSDGHAVFDSWRILMFARSTGDEAMDQESLRVAALEHPSIQAISGDRFGWPDHRYDINWQAT